MSKDILAKHPTREQILAGGLDELVADIHNGDGIAPPLLSIEQRMQSRDAMLAELEEGADTWVFAYGSLIWNPAFHFEENLTGRVFGWHRQFSFWTYAGRGTPELPGLMLGLESGGSCHGMVYRIHGDKRETELAYIWMREMLTDVYHPRWVTVRTQAGPKRAITFVVNTDHSQHVTLPVDTRAHHIAHATGRLGTCRDYLFETNRHLADLGISDRNLLDIERRVRRLLEQ